MAQGLGFVWGLIRLHLVRKPCIGSYFRARIRQGWLGCYGCHPAGKQKEARHAEPEPHNRPGGVGFRVWGSGFGV